MVNFLSAELIKKPVLPTKPIPPTPPTAPEPNPVALGRTTSRSLPIFGRPWLLEIENNG
jgi:hypothetical protein